MIPLCVWRSLTRRIRHHCYWLFLLSSLLFSRYWKIMCTFRNSISWTLSVGLIIYQAKCRNRKGSYRVFIKSFYWGALETIARHRSNKTNNKEARCQTFHLYCHQYLTVMGRVRISLILCWRVSLHWRIYTWIRRLNWIL